MVGSLGGISLMWLGNSSSLFVRTNIRTVFYLPWQIQNKDHVECTIVIRHLI